MIHRITDDSNKIPIFNYERSKFQKLKGKDFNINVKPTHSYISKRKLTPLNSENNNENNKLLFKSQMFLIPDQNEIERFGKLNKSSILS
jgi:hypothetical protein